VHEERCAVTMTFEVQQFIETNKPLKTVAYNLQDKDSGVKALLELASTNPGKPYRLVEIVVDFITVTHRYPSGEVES
jgi:hypothetical protein